MPTTLPTLSANPLEIIRSFPTTLIPIDKIVGPVGHHKDDIFTSKYTAFLLGKMPIHESRLSLESIRRGLWQTRDSGFELVGDTPKHEFVENAKEMIRLGSRPVLHLYENPNKSDNKRFVCTDDTATHAAYEALGITVVPIALMGKPRHLEESCISVKSFRKSDKEWISLIDGVVPTIHDSLPSVLGVSKPTGLDSFDNLLTSIRATKDALRRFHQAGAYKFHYHHTLYSVLMRAEESVESMRLLVDARKVLVAACLLRSLHELALTFYVDWLAPGQTYRYLQLASVMPEKDWEKSCEKSMREHIAAGLSAIDAKQLKDAHMRGYRLCSIVGEKARVFPFGEKFQRDIYSFLSDILHHDFSMTARYTHTLDHGDEAIFSEDVAATILHVADLLIGAIVSRIRSDIGQDNQTALTQ